jgi:hypothetical protein
MTGGIASAGGPNDTYLFTRTCLRLSLRPKTLAVVAVASVLALLLFYAPKYRFEHYFTPPLDESAVLLPYNDLPALSSTQRAETSSTNDAEVPVTTDLAQPPDVLPVDPDPWDSLDFLNGPPTESFRSAPI